MSGHSKWSTIKRKKAAVDSARGKVFTKLIREITVAAREGGGDEESNHRLRTAIGAARSANMPNDTIKRAVQRGTGDLEGVHYEEKIYEGYGPGGVALFIQTLSDNTNRTTGEIRHILSRHSGNLGESGCVAWMFKKVGVLTVEGDESRQDAIMEAGLEAGLEDLTVEDGQIEVTTAPDKLMAVKEALENAGHEVASAELTFLPNSTVTVEGKDAERVLKLMEALDDQDDVQRVSSNFDIPDEVLREVASG